MNIIRYKTEETYGAAGHVDAPLKATLYASSIGQRAVIGTIEAIIECPCCKAGINIKLDIDQPL